ncbi:MAG: alanyl-tRNA editing protein [Acidobacteria bacterium]|nr:alanyl-tRNA editing protein [Acidobacteriota bacterium]
MTSRLYYTDSFLYEFDARVIEVADREDSSGKLRAAVILDQSALYPTSGGQPFDTGTLSVAHGSAARVVEVVEDERGDILHLLESRPDWLKVGAALRGSVDVERRRDHMQQHSGQHVLSAAFVRLFGMATVSFHLGEEICTIDLDTRAIHPKQLADAARCANEVVMEDRQVEIVFADLETARARGVRKLPDVEREELRLIDIRDFDLTACGGTHVRSTGQIGPILLRKIENVKQAVRVEFVCGARALATAQRDFDALTQAAAVFSAHIWQLPELAERAQDDLKAAAKAQQKLLEEVADLHARQWVREAAMVNGGRVISRVVRDRDVAFTKMLAQKIAANGAVALLASTAGAPTLVFAQPSEMKSNLGDIMKQVLAPAGGRGGGSKDFAQGGVADASAVDQALATAQRLL